MSAILDFCIRYIMVKAEGRCSLGLYDGGRCENIKQKNVCDSLRVMKVNILNEDVPDLFKTVNNRDLKFCGTATYKESWLISQRFGGKLQDNSTICERHRAKYERPFQGFTKCRYPVHVDTKKKLSLRPISLSCAYQAEAVYSIAAKKVTVPIGSPWCNCCRLSTHPNIIAEHETMLKQLCQVCFQPHNRETR